MQALEENQADRELLARLGREAGHIAMRYFGKSGADNEVWWKEGQSPVSAADYAVDTFLKEKLLAERPDYGWLSEETVDSKERLSARRTFVVDPIDGTRGFLNGLNQWCISIAVVEDNRPVCGVLEAPVLDVCVSALAGQGAWANGRQLFARSTPDTIEMTGPRSMLDEMQTVLPEDVKKTPFVPSLAWRLAMVALGELDVALARGSACDWDLAAADLIVHEAGGRLTDLRNRQLTYNCPSTRQGTLVASQSLRHEEMLDIARIAMNKKID